MYFLLFFFGILAGVTTVLFGFGGGFVVVPVLYAVLTGLYGVHSAMGEAAMHIAVATSTCVMIFGVSIASWRHHKAGTLLWEHIRPLMLYIGLGAILGAYAATAIQGEWLRWAFVLYLAITIADSLLRSGFLQRQSHQIRHMNPLQTSAYGIGIGTIATLLGVGGSVMTVSLMRRRGASMTEATAMANPLSLPVAIAGSLTYMLLDNSQQVSLGAGYLGYVNLPAALILMAASWLGIRLAAPWIGKISDRLHATIYILLLSLVLLVMLVN